MYKIYNMTTAIHLIQNLQHNRMREYYKGIIFNMYMYYIWRKLIFQQVWED